MKSNAASVPASGRRKRVGLLATIVSVLSAFFGVQGSRNRERDFSHGSPVLFFVVAVALTATFALILLGVVHLILGRVATAG